MVLVVPIGCVIARPAILNQCTKVDAIVDAVFREKSGGAGPSFMKSKRKEPQITQIDADGRR
jgi:hypothetical protein